MNLRHLEVFNAIMQTGSVTGAARLLNVTQPAVSNMLRHAEQQIRFKLFERRAGRLHPTPEASGLFPDVEEIFGRIDTLNRAVDDIRDGRAGRITIAASPTFVNAYLPTAVARLRDQSPAAQVTVHALPTAQVIEDRVARREIDLGLVYAPVTDPGVSIQEIARSRAMCAVPRTSPLALLDVISPADIAGKTMIGTSPSSRINAAINITNVLHGIEMPPVSIEVNTLQAACLMVAQDIGVALVDRATMDQHRGADVVFRPFRPEIDLSICLIFPAHRPRSRLAMRLAECLRALLLNEARPAPTS